MNGNERIYVKRYFAETCEDSFEHGELPDSVGSSWSSKDLPVNGRFDTIEEALKAVCEANGFDYNREDWLNWATEFGEDEAGRFSLSVLVDNNNSEASESEIAEWREGKTRLWNCDLNVYLGVVAERELTMDELTAA